ncbi:MAG: RagB/SusD family nutrient uptake outer membrane protein [Bacteroidales bacterium]|nr:RagB/SusD family nutrient uptake outer membrane protein [Bacteroidales bacterium]
MKNKYIVPALCAALALVSCNKFLDTSLDLNNTTETIATSRNSIWAFAGAFYSPAFYGYSVVDGNLFAAASDEAQQTLTSAQIVYFNKGIVNASANPLWFLYTNFYEGIRAANFFLDYVSDGKGKALIEQNRNLITDAVNYQRDLQSLDWYIAEAHIARAYYYGELIKMYGGVPIIEKAEAGTKNIARSSYDECVSYIVDEIDSWKGKLATDWEGNDAYTGRFTLGAALAIKARVLLYAASPLHNPTGDWSKWEKAARAAADVIELGAYSLDANYETYFVGNRTISSPETIWAVRRGTSNTLERNNYPIATSGGASGVCPTQNLVNAYEWTGTVDANDPYANRDPRLAATVVFNGSTWNSRTIAQAAGESDDMARTNASRTGYYLKKFLKDDLNLTQDAKEQHNWIAFRYGEILLDYAEAVNEAYGPSTVPAGYPMSAEAALKMVRDRASASLPPVNAGTVDAFRTAIKHERQVELAFEDHRYWDLLRWKDAMDVLNQPVQGVKITKTATGYSYQVRDVASRTFNARNYYLPFLRSEIENSAGSLQQNPGY